MEKDRPSLFSRFRRQKRKPKGEGNNGQETANLARSIPSPPSPPSPGPKGRVADQTDKCDTETTSLAPVEGVAVVIAVSALNESAPDPAAIQSSATLPSCVEDPDVSVTVWDQAYDNLKTGPQTAKLVEIYEKILSSVLQVGLGAQDSTFLRDDNALNTLNIVRTKRIVRMGDITRLALVKASSHEFIDLSIQTAIDFVKKIQNAVNTMLTAYPPAAMAWSGICTILPILASPSLQNIAMKNGLLFVVGKMEWYIAITRVSLKSQASSHELSSLRDLTQSKIIQLVQSLLEFEMRSVCTCYTSNSLVRILESMLSLNDWGERIEKLKTLESEISNQLSQFRGASNTTQLDIIGENTARLSSIVSEMKMMRERQDKETKAQIEARRLELVAKFNTDTTCPYAERMGAIEKRVAGTCEWFQTHEKYQAWLDSPDSGLLLLSADPGCGKSVLSRFLIEEVLPERMSSAALCYFFFKDSPDQDNLPAALTALIHQILSRYPELAERVTKEIVENGSGLTRMSRTLWNILEKITASDIGRDVVFVLDALDECQRADRIMLVQQIQQLLQQNRRSASKVRVATRVLKFIVTTRGYPEILQLFKTFSSGYIRLAGENTREVNEIQTEITLVVDHRISRLAEQRGFDEKRKGEIRQSLMLKGGQQRTYLWVRLVFEVLEANLRDQTQVWRRLVNTVPNTVHDAYDKLLEKVREVDKDRVMMLLRMMTASFRPIPVQTAIILLGARDYAESKEEMREDDEPEWESDGSFKDWVKGSCGIFVTIYDEQLFFIHQTAKEFLQAPARPTLPGSTSRSFRHSITEAEAHRDMAENCIAAWKYGGFRDSDERLKYGTELWAQHFRDAQTFTTVEGEVVVDDVDDRFWEMYVSMWDDPQFIRAQSLSSFLERHDPETYKAPYTMRVKLSFLATFGHYRLLGRLLHEAKSRGEELAVADMPFLFSGTRAQLQCAKLLLQYIPSRPIIIVDGYD